jgi:hypothetical protein
MNFLKIKIYYDRAAYIVNEGGIHQYLFPFMDYCLLLIVSMMKEGSSWSMVQ